MLLVLLTAVCCSFQNCCVMRYTTAGQLWNIISQESLLTSPTLWAIRKGFYLVVNVSKPLTFLSVCCKF